MKQVFYLPPPDEAIEQYASEICEHLGPAVDPAFGRYEVRYGLAEFLKVMARIRANIFRAATSSEENNAAA